MINPKVVKSHLIIIVLINHFYTEHSRNSGSYSCPNEGEMYPVKHPFCDKFRRNCNFDDILSTKRKIPSLRKEKYCSLGEERTGSRPE